VDDRAAQRVEWACVALVVAAAAVAFYLVTRPSDHQPQVSVDLLPIADGARRIDTFVDCSKVNSLAYFTHNPCETFVLVRGSASGSGSAIALLRSEAATLRGDGWVHPTLRPVADYDDVSSAMAPLRDSWVAPGSNACAYVATARAGVLAEGKGFLCRRSHGPVDVLQRSAGSPNRRSALGTVALETDDPAGRLQREEAVSFDARETAAKRSSAGRGLLERKRSSARTRARFCAGGSACVGMAISAVVRAPAQEVLSGLALNESSCRMRHVPFGAPHGDGRRQLVDELERRSAT
jgi:hypothetical protein